MFYIYIIFSFVNLSLAALGLHCCAGFSLVVVHGFLIAVASLIAEQGFLGALASVASTCGLSSSGSGSLAVMRGLCSCCVGSVAPLYVRP